MHLSIQIDPVILFSDPTNRFWGRRTFFHMFDRVFVFFVFFFLGDVTNPGKRMLLSVGRWVVGPWPYGPNDNPTGPTTTLLGQKPGRKIKRKQRLIFRPGARAWAITVCRREGPGPKGQKPGRKIKRKQRLIFRPGARAWTIKVLSTGGPWP